MLFSKKNLKEELKGKIKKLDIEKIINDDVVKNDTQTLISRMTGSTDKTARFINNQYKTASKDFFPVIEKKLNEIISDEVVGLINKTLEAYNSKCALENEIAGLKKELSSMDPADNYKKSDLKDLIEENKDKLEEKEKAFKEFYREALKKTVIPPELKEIFDQIREIEDEEREQLHKEIELQEAKLNALKLLTIDLLYESERLIDKRINASVALVSENAIKSSNTKTPIIKYFIK